MNISCFFIFGLSIPLRAMPKINVFLIIPIFTVITSCNDLSFNSEKWKNWKETESNIHMRWDMVDDLIDNYHLIGKTHHEIEELLGKPENRVSSSKDNYYYNLGPCRSGIDYGSLYIEFKNSKVDNVGKNCG